MPCVFCAQCAHLLPAWLSPPQAVELELTEEPRHFSENAGVQPWAVGLDEEERRDQGPQQKADGEGGQHVRRSSYESSGGAKAANLAPIRPRGDLGA